MAMKILSRIARQKYRGMSLVEMMVAIAIFLLMMSGLSMLFLQSFRSNTFIIEEGRTTFFNQRAVQKGVNEFRRARQADNGAYPLDSGSNNSVTFYADTDSDGQTERVHYFLDGTELKRGIRHPTAGTPVTYASGDETVTVVATAIVNTSAQPVFTYYNANYPGDTVNNPIATPIAVSAVRLVKAHLAMNIDPNHAPDNINFESFAELRNLNEYGQ